jgi:hypothetical protein
MSKKSRQKALEKLAESNEITKIAQELSEATPNTESGADDFGDKLFDVLLKRLQDKRLKEIKSEN